MPSELGQVVDVLKVEDDFDTSRLKQCTEKRFLLDTSRQGIDVYRFFPPSYTQDAFRYLIYFDAHSHQFWISRHGGIADVAEYYGPCPTK